MVDCEQNVYRPIGNCDLINRKTVESWFHIYEQYLVSDYHSVGYFSGILYRLINEKEAGHALYQH